MKNKWGNKININKKVLYILVFILFSNYAFSELDLQFEITNNPCSNERISFKLRIYNTGSTSVQINQLKVRLWFNSTSDPTLNDYGSGLYNPNNWLGNILQRTVGTWPYCDDSPGRKANRYLDITFNNTSSIMPNQYLESSGDMPRANPFDPECDDYSTHLDGADPSPMGSYPYVALYLNNVLQAEVLSGGAPDPNTGKEPCSIPTSTPTNTPPYILNIARETHGATSVATVNVILETPTFTPTFTPTNTRTNTPTNTRTNTPTNTATNTLTNTPTNTRTNTPTNTATNTLTNTPTNTRTNTPTNTATNTPTNTNTITNTATNTVTNTPTNTRTNTPTNTATNTPTNTATNTVTNTPTNTATNTPTNTPTDTKTNTPTNTLTNTRTNTPTNTVTNTFTNTNTQTYTPTLTWTGTPPPTWTPTNTFTNTNTRTNTNTPTDTFTSTFTNTPTNTRTNTPTNTVTNTFTNTNTQTYTPTLTWTGTPPPTWTPTNTFTNTNTRTNTETPTDTRTPTNTFTLTNTFTPSYTRTSTNTPTNTNTPSNTPTFTNTNLPTNTDTNTPTNTFTRTNTPSNTNTRTNTSTPTETNTYTYTSTVTNTNTFTFTNTFSNTPTNTNTRTNTNTPTETFTFTFTNTITNTYTSTYTSTHTNTPTDTFTPSNTPTRTNTPTITMTLPPYPYILTIEVYNEAGERVRFITETKITNRISDVLLVLNGIESDNLNRTFNPAEESLKIKIPGLETPDQRDKGFIEFEWDGNNNNGQNIGNGVYYIKFTTQDGYGHSEVLIKDVMLVKSEQYIRLNIYNSAGELVRRIENYYLPLGSVKLNIDDVLYVGKNSDSIDINYADGQKIEWDGLNSHGVIVSTGIYEIQIEVKTEQGYKVIASKTVSIISQVVDDILKNIKIYPNPYYIKGENTGKITMKWENLNSGNVDIKIYNLAGELIRKLHTTLESGKAEWDLKTSTGQMVVSGLYIIVVEGKKITGEREIKSIKLTIINKNTLKEDRVN